jgi:fructose-1,6-bisphosphatase
MKGEQKMTVTEWMAFYGERNELSLVNECDMNGQRLRRTNGKYVIDKAHVVLHNSPSITHTRRGDKAHVGNYNSFNHACFQGGLSFSCIVVLLLPFEDA